MNENRLLDPAKVFLKAYFSDGIERKPSDFDVEILGGMDTNFLFTHPRWNNTPFFEALGELIEENIILFRQLDDGTYVYWMETNSR